MKNILHVVGTRPQYIKLYPLWEKIQSSSRLNQRIYDTGQHYDENMSSDLVVEFGFKNIFVGNIQGLGPDKQIPLMIENIWNQLIDFSPDYVVVYGDTNTTLAASIACAKLNIPYGHVEAGVRTDANVGYQEGVNRKVADHLATHLFCVGKMDCENLINEGIEKIKIFHSGDLMSDAFKLTREKSVTQKVINKTKALSILVTLHRSENVDDSLIRKKLLATLDILSRKHRVILPIHPRFKSMLEASELKRLEDSDVELVSPLKYSEIVSTLAQVDGVVTDSGGLPKDAAYAGVKSVVLRSDPIWHELAKQGYIHKTSKFREMDANELVKHIEIYIDGKWLNPFEGPDASMSIVDTIMDYLDR